MKPFRFLFRFQISMKNWSLWRGEANDYLFLMQIQMHCAERFFSVQRHVIQFSLVLHRKKYRQWKGNWIFNPEVGGNSHCSSHVPLCSFLSNDWTYENYFAHTRVATWLLFPAYLGILCFVYVASLKGTVAKYDLAHNADVVKIRFYKFLIPKQFFHEIKMHLRNVYLFFEIEQQQKLKMHFLVLKKVLPIPLLEVCFKNLIKANDWSTEFWLGCYVLNAWFGNFDKSLPKRTEILSRQLNQLFWFQSKDI